MNKTLIGVTAVTVLTAGVLIFTMSGSGDEEFKWGLHIVIFDVGQADAIAIVAPNEDVVLIDAGKLKRDSQKVAEFLLDLEANRVGKPLDEAKLAFVTHYDEDHMGGKVWRKGLHQPYATVGFPPSADYCMNSYSFAFSLDTYLYSFWWRRWREELMPAAKLVLKAFLNMRVFPAPAPRDAG